MRVAISGTHCCGKSTLIAEFLLVYPKYNHEPEPYAVLVEEYGEILSAESVDDFYRQLEFMVERLQGYRPGDRVIFERSPVDFAAYMLALDDLGRDRTGTRFVEDCLEIVRNAIQQLDLILFLPLNEKDSFDEEDPVLRTAVNDRLVEIYRNSDLNLFVSERPSIIEAFGPTTQRLRTLESALAK
jgi:AAA domain